jgi:hypothetical protein
MSMTRIVAGSGMWLFVVMSNGPPPGPPLRYGRARALPILSAENYATLKAVCLVSTQPRHSTAAVD